MRVREREIPKESSLREDSTCSSLFLALSIGNLSIRFEDRTRPTLRIAVERPTANDDNFRAVFAGMREFANPSVIALEFFANIGERLGMRPCVAACVSLCRMSPRTNSRTVRARRRSNK